MSKNLQSRPIYDAFCLPLDVQAKCRETSTQVILSHTKGLQEGYQSERARFQATSAWYEAVSTRLSWC